MPSEDQSSRAVPVVTTTPLPSDALTDTRPLRDAHFAVPSMAELLQLAVNKGTPVAELRELVALHEHMNARQAEQDFFDALGNFQAECPPIKKNKTAKFATEGGGRMSYTYATIDEIARAVGPLLRKHGFSYRWDSEEQNNKLVCTCILQHRNGHSTRSSIALPSDSKAAMSAQQKVGAALTFARRLSLTSALGLTTTDDDTDGRDDTASAITPEQADALNTLIDDVGVNRPRLMRWLGVDSLAKIPAAHYASTVQMIESKRVKS